MHRDFHNYVGIEQEAKVELHVESVNYDLFVFRWTK